MFNKAEPSDLCWFELADLKKLSSSQKEQLLCLPWVQNAPIGEAIRKALGPPPSFGSLKAAQPAVVWNGWPPVGDHQMEGPQDDMLFPMNEEPAASDLSSSFRRDGHGKGSILHGDLELDAKSPIDLLFGESSEDEDDAPRKDKGDDSPMDDLPSEEGESAETASQSQRHDLRSSGPRLIVGVPQPSFPKAVDSKASSANFGPIGSRPSRRKLKSELDIICGDAGDRVRSDPRVEEEYPRDSSRKLERVHSAGHCQSNLDEPTVPLKFPPWKSSSSSRISNI